MITEEVIVPNRFEPSTFQLIAERANRLRHVEQHKDVFKYFEKCFCISQWEIFNTDNEIEKK